jgi:hypothetical protein
MVQPLLLLLEDLKTLEIREWKMAESMDVWLQFLYGRMVSFGVEKPSIYRRKLAAMM